MVSSQDISSQSSSFQEGAYQAISSLEIPVESFESGESQNLAPKVIFLDAVGTIFGVRGSVGAQYGRVLREFLTAGDSELAARPEAISIAGEIDPNASFAADLDRAFFAAFKASPPCAFPNVSPAERSQLEYDWWQAIARDTLTATGWIDRLDFDAFFARLFDYFKTADPWFLYPEVPGVLERWRSRGIALGVVSNFDSRLHGVLDALDLARWFDSVTSSSETGAAKPDPKIFQIALEKHGCAPEAAWHLGDSRSEDCAGAAAAGIRAFWVRRPG